MRTYRGVWAWPIMRPRSSLSDDRDHLVGMAFQRALRASTSWSGTRGCVVGRWGLGPVRARKRRRGAGRLCSWQHSMPGDGRAGSENGAAEQRGGSRRHGAVGRQIASWWRRELFSSSLSRGHPRTSPKGPPRRGASARAALRSCPKPHQLLDFLLQRDSKAVGPPAPSRRSVASRRPWPWTMRRSGDRRGFVRGRCDATAAGASAAWPALSANSPLMTKGCLQKLQVDVHNTFLPRRSRVHYSYFTIENYRQLYHLFAIFFCFAPCSIRQNDQT